MSRRLEGIDAMRGICALLVVIQHTLPFYLLGNTLWSNHPLFYLDVGRIGVAAFFLISGYVIPFSIPSNSSPSSYKIFWIRRFFRLWPAYWFAIACAVLFGVDDHTVLKPFQLLVNLTMLQQFVGVPNAIGVFWTLQIELCFYFFITFLLLLGWLNRPGIEKKLCIVWIIIALGLAVVRGMRFHDLPVAIPIAMSLMFLASAIRDARIASTRYPIFLVVFVQVLIVPICCFGYPEREGSVDDPYRLALAYDLAVFIFIFFERLQTMPRFLVFLGTISYSVYLIHEVIIRQIERANLMNNGVLTVVLVISTTLIAATVSYFLIEKPAHALGRRL